MTEQTGTDLVYAHASLNERKDYAQALAMAGSLLPDGLMENGRPSAGKVFLVAETGNMLGIHPIASITGVNIIKGKPTIAPTLMAALVRQRGHKLRVKVDGSVATGDIAVTVTLIRKDDPEAVAEAKWTMDDAIDAGLVESYALNTARKRWVVKPAPGKGPWGQYPRQMLLHRATAEVCRQGASEVLMGVYTPEELGADVNSEGDLVDVTATAVDRTRYEQDHDGPAVIDAMRTGETGNPESKPEQGIVGTSRGVANETDGSGRSNRQDTPPKDTRPRPSRTKAEPGAGRTDEPARATQNPSKTPSDDDRRHIADEWADRARKALTVTDARDLYRDANHRGLLDYPTSSGELLGDVLRARGEHLADEEAHADEPAPEDEPLPLELPY